MMTHLLSSPFSWLTLLAILGVVIWELVDRLRSRKWGFKEALKDPGHWEQAEKRRAEVAEEVREAQSWDDAQVASFTRKYVLEAVSSTAQWDEAKILSGLGERTHETVLGLLQDPALRERLTVPTSGGRSPEAPFNRACDLLGHTPPAQAAELLAPFLEHPSDEIRKDAALALAKTGAASICPALRQAFADPNKYVCSHALIGLDYALSRNGLAGTVRSDLFADVLELVQTDRNADDAAKILCRLSPEEARTHLLSAPLFSANSPVLHDVLGAMIEAKLTVPRQQLLEVIAELESQTLEYPQTYALGRALHLLGRLQQEEDRPLFRKHSSHPEEEVAEGAAAGLVCSLGLEGYEERLWERERESGYESLSEPQRWYSAVFMCHAEAENGSFAQYFVNHNGDHWRDALAGYRAMGFRDRLKTFEKALAHFGKDGPSTDLETRRVQLSKLIQRDDTRFDALSMRYHNSSENIEVFLSRFALENPEAFR